MTPEVSCFHCGVRNRVPEGWGRLRGKCNNCGTALLSPVKVSSGSESNRRKSLGSASSFLFKLLVLLIIIAISYLSLIGWSNRETLLPMLARIDSTLPQWLAEQKERYFPETPPIPIKKSPPPVVQRPGVMWNKSLLIPQAPFRIQTSPGTDYYIKLVDAGTNRDAMAIYVVGGRDLEVLVPLGSYRLRYAYGKIWRGEQHLFGPGGLTRVEEALKSLDFNMSFESINGHIVELIPQIGGNMPTRDIPRDRL